MNEIDYSLHYSRWHNESDQHYELTAKFYDDLLNLTAVPHDSVVLDIGCGPGLLVHALRRSGVEDVRGIDISREQIDVALKRNLPCIHVDENFIYRHAQESEERYDRIYLLDVLEHVPKQNHIPLLKAIHRLLRPGGGLWISVPNASSTFAMRWQFIDWTHECSFTEHSLDFVALNAGFISVKHHPYEFILRPRLPYLPRPGVTYWYLNRIFRAIRRLQAVSEMGKDGWSVPLSLNLLVECRKEQ